jgi:hypothetical protein
VYLSRMVIFHGQSQILTSIWVVMANGTTHS